MDEAAGAGSAPRPWRPAAGGLALAVRLTPRGGRDRIEGLAEAGGRPVLRARVAAPPVDGAANAALAGLIARALGLPRSAVSIAGGATARVKTLALAGDPAALADRLETLVAGGAEASRDRTA